MGLSVLIASSGRPSLHRAVASTVGQLTPGDELLIDVNDDAPWGGAARNRMIPRARGNVLFMDDDDVYAPGALGAVRAAVGLAPERVHLFRMSYDWGGRLLWEDPEVRCGNVSTQMVVAPCGTQARFTDRYEGDYDFIAEAVALHGDPVWHEEVIAVIRPTLESPAAISSLH